MATIKYKSDYMSRKMDKELDELEEKITALYVSAVNQVTAKFNTFAASFADEMKKMQYLLSEGAITKDDYFSWVQRNVVTKTAYKENITSLTNILVNTDKAAMATVRGELPYVLAQSYNFTQALGWKAADEAGMSVGTFQVYNAKAVEKIIRDNPSLLPAVDIPADQKWNKDRINTEITQGIIQGDSIPQIATRLQNVTGMDKNAALRTARTSMTYAENLGRDEGYLKLKAKGIPVKKIWSAVIDSRTRDTHRLLNGTYANEDGLFGEGILDKDHLLRCPADPNGEPHEIYNCRCREGVVFDKPLVDHSNDDELYEEFLKTNYPDDYEKLKKKDYFNTHTTKPIEGEEREKLKAKVAKRQTKAKNTEKWVDKLKKQETVEDIFENYYKNKEDYEKWRWSYPDNHPKHVEGGYEAIKRYTGGGYTDINKYLRGQEYKGDWWFSSPEEDAALIHKVIANAELPQDVYTIRKTTAHALETLFGNGSVDAIKAGKGRDFIGSVVMEKGFYSSSMATTTAYNTPFNNYEVEFITLLPKGTNAIYISGNVGRYGAEYEILTIDGASFIVRNIIYSENGFTDISDRQSGSKIRVYLEKISDGTNNEQ